MDNLMVVTRYVPVEPKKVRYSPLGKISKLWQV